MSATCTYCSRPSPRGAAYCYHDGRPLEGATAAAAPGMQVFPSPLVFPSGRVCQTFDQLALACQDEWASAADLLQQGVMEQFLGNLGRADLALAARAAANFPDRDRGLDQLLARLPSQALTPPKLYLGTAEFNLGTIKADADQVVYVELENRGMRLLYGTVTSDVPWLTLGEQGFAQQKLFQCATLTTVSIRLVHSRLRAGNKGMQGRVIVESNGGTAAVTVRLEVPAELFTQGVLAGATTPRQLAEKARLTPLEAAPLFENGSVAAWYRANGWTYPVQGPSAAGLGAVQQFFEALGLAKPPRVELSEPAITFHGHPGQAVSKKLQITTAEKRPVFAHAVSNQSWLAVGPTELHGPVATLPLQVSAIPQQPGQTLRALVTVTANGGQRFEVPVTLTVTKGSRTSPAAATVISTASKVSVSPATGKARPKAGLQDKGEDEQEETPALAYFHALPLALLSLALLIVLIRDMVYEPEPPQMAALIAPQPEQKSTAKNKAEPVIVSRIVDEPPEFDASIATPPPVRVSIVDEKEERPPGKPQPVRVEITDEADNNPAGPVGKADVDLRPQVVWQYGPGMRFGIAAVQTKKLLTYAANGETNQTLLRVNGQDGEFGGPLGKFTERDTKMPANTAKKNYGGSKSVWVSGKLYFTQIIELVPSKQPVLLDGKPKHLLDTVRVRYLIENKDNKTHTIGLRMQMDTLIGGNDGVPFAVPGLQGMVTNFADFPKVAPIPDFIQALELPNLQNPGTVAHMSFKLGGGIEPPGRVSLTHWPGNTFPSWDVPLVPIAGDSAVVLYWNEQALKAGQKREAGFAYGLGSVASNDPGGKLGVTLGGSFEPGEAFTVTAYVQNPPKGQTLSLDVPQGLERIEGKQVQNVPPPTAGSTSSIVTWKVKVLQTGTFPLKVTSNNGLSQVKTISIARPEGASDVQLTMDLTGSFEPGQEFTVHAKLKSAEQAAAPEPVLNVPSGLLTTSGPSLQSKASSKEATWKVKVGTPGKYPVRVEWNGAAVTKTVTIVRPETPAGGYVGTTLHPPFAPGKAFTVTATVHDPVPGQALVLQLPAGLRLMEGAESTPVTPPQSGPAVVNWKVMVDRPGTYPLKLVSSAGLTLKKTITIEQPDDKGGSFKLDTVGEIAPGKEFTVRAKVTNPMAGQKLTLLPLPKELELVQGPMSQNAAAVVNWRVRVLEKGTLPVRVSSTTGVVQSFTITFVEQPADAGPQIFGGKR